MLSTPSAHSGFVSGGSANGYGQASGTAATGWSSAIQQQPQHQQLQQQQQLQQPPPQQQQQQQQQFVNSYFRPSLAAAATAAARPSGMHSPHSHGVGYGGTLDSMAYPSVPPMSATLDGPPNSEAQAQPPGMASIYDLMSSGGVGIGGAVGMPGTIGEDVRGFTPLHTASPRAAAASPMSISPSPLRSTGFQAGASSPAAATTGQAYAVTPHKLNPEFQNTVTVFGFPPDSSPFVLSLFRNFGTILEYQHVGNSNWMNIQYATELSAQMALSKNGMILGGDTMVGVVPMKRAHGKSSSDDRSLSSLLSPLKSGASPASPSHQRMLASPGAGAGAGVVKEQQQPQRIARKPFSTFYGDDDVFGEEPNSNSKITSARTAATTTTTTTTTISRTNAAAPEQGRPSIVSGILESVFGWG